MIAKKYRLDRRSIAYILKKGSNLKSQYFIYRTVENNENFSQYCVIISRKISNKAVTRNKLRRQIFEAIRINQDSDSFPRKIVLIPKKNILKATFSEIASDIISILQNGQNQ